MRQRLFLKKLYFFRSSVAGSLFAAAFSFTQTRRNEGALETAVAFRSLLRCVFFMIRLGFFDFREEGFDKRGVWFEFYCVFLAVEIGNIYV